MIRLENRPKANHHHYHHQHQHHHHQGTTDLGQDSRKQFLRGGGSRPQQRLTARQVKRLRQKRLAALSFSQQVLVNGDTLLQIPEDGEAVFNDPPLDHVVDDLSVSHIYNDIEQQQQYCTTNNTNAADGFDDKDGGDIVSNMNVIYEDSDSSHSRESSNTLRTAESTESGQYQEVSVTKIPSSPVSSRENRSGARVDVGDSFDRDDTTTASTTFTVTTAGGPIDVDRIQETDEQFDAIWKAHEDEYFVWQEGAKHTEMSARDIKKNGRYECVENKLYRGLPIHAGSPEESENLDDSVTHATCSSLDTFGFVREKKVAEYISPSVHSRISAADSKSRGDSVTHSSRSSRGANSVPREEDSCHSIHSKISADSNTRCDSGTHATCTSVETFGFVREQQTAEHNSPSINSRISAADSKTRGDSVTLVSRGHRDTNGPIDSKTTEDSASLASLSSYDTYGFAMDKNAAGCHSRHANSSLPFDSERPEDFVTIATCSSDTFDFLRQRKATAGAALVADDDSSLELMEHEAEKMTRNETKSQFSYASPDVPVVGTPVDKAAAALLNEINQCPSHNDAEFLATNSKHEQEQEQEQQGKNPAHSNNDNEISTTNNSHEAVSVACKARQLRALRLRAAIKDKNELAKNSNRIRPITPEEEKESGHCGMVNVVRVNTSSSQSVVSDITNLSEKLFLKVGPKSEGKWDDISSIGYSMVEQETTTNGKGEYDGQGRIDRDERHGNDMEDTPMHFDSSIQTQPICYMNPNIKAQLEQQGAKARQHSESGEYQHKYSGESKWDDVSSIGLMGVETMNTKFKKQLSSKSSRHDPLAAIHFAVQPRPEEDSDDESSLVEVGKNQNISDIFRKRVNLADSDDDEENSRGTPTFSTLWAEETGASKTKISKVKSVQKNCHLEINPTFSTVFVESCDSYYSDTSGDNYSDTSGSVSDLEMPPARQKDKVSTSTTIGSDFCDQIQSLALITVTVLVVIAVAAIAGFALYVYSGA